MPGIKECFRIKNTCRAELLISLFLFIIVILSAKNIGGFRTITLLNAIYSSILIIQILIYALIRRFGYSKRYALLYHTLFLAMFVLAVYSFFIVPALSVALMFGLLYNIINVALGAVFLSQLLFLVIFGVYYARKQNYKFAIFLFAILIAALALSAFLLSQQGYSLNDEDLLAFTSVNFLVHGLNPYATSVAPTISSASLNGTLPAVSMTTTNDVVSYVTYPALFFLTFVPFYFLSQPNLYNVSHIDAPVEIMIFLLILILVIVFSTEKKNFSTTKLDLILIAPLFIFFIASPLQFLIGALLIICYTRIQSKYSWLFLGIAVSIQEELWLPVLFLITYSLNNDGLKKGARNLFGTALVFLIINSYFIASSPVQFLKLVVFPISAPLIPQSYAPIGYYLLVNYHVLLSIFTPMLLLAVAILLAIFLYLNRKELLGPFCCIPFLFFFHALLTYYTIFIFLFVFSACGIGKKKEAEGRLYEYLNHSKGLKYTVCVFIIFLIAVMAFSVYLSHNGYLHTFNITISNQSIYTINNITHYSANLSYSNISVNSIYLQFIFSSYSHSNIFGTFIPINQSLLPRPQNCNTLHCIFNPNVLQLPKNRTSVPINIAIAPLNNTQFNVVTIRAYNNTYFYISETAYNKTG